MISLPLFPHLWWQGFEDGHEEFDDVIVGGEFTFQEEILLMQNDLRVDVFDQNPKRLGGPVGLLVPLEIWRNGRLHE